MRNVRGEWLDGLSWPKSTITRITKSKSISAYATRRTVAFVRCPFRQWLTEVLPHQVPPLISPDQFCCIASDSCSWVIGVDSVSDVNWSSWPVIVSSYLFMHCVVSHDWLIWLIDWITAWMVLHHVSSFQHYYAFTQLSMFVFPSRNAEQCLFLTFEISLSSLFPCLQHQFLDLNQGLLRNEANTSLLNPSNCMNV